MATIEDADEALRFAHTIRGLAKMLQLAGPVEMTAYCMAIAMLIRETTDDDDPKWEAETVTLVEKTIHDALASKELMK